MSKIDDIKDIIQLALLSPILEFSLEYEDVKLAFTKMNLNRSEPVLVTNMPHLKVESTEKIDEATVNTQQPEFKEILSSMVGTFFSSPNPDSPPYVKLGDIVTEDTVVGVVEAMKLFNEIHADISGEIVQILVENGQLVEYGQPLFLVRPT